MSLIRRTYNYYFSKEKDLARKLNNVLGFTPRHLNLFKMAFYHRSMNNDDHYAYNNERLEYLGDSVLSTVVAEYLFHKYPTKDEGFLTKMRSKIVKRKTLNDIADQMGLDVILSDYSQGKLSHSMLGNAMEALVGALYIEMGYKKTSDYIIKKILMHFLDIHQLEHRDDNHKSALLEWCQKSGKDVNFILLEKTKFDKRDFFRIAVVVNGKEMGTAEDFNKKSAEQMASKLTIAMLGDQAI